MSKCPFPCLESSPTPSHLPKPCMRKISFSKQNLLFLKIHYRISVKIWDYPLRRMCWRTFQNNTWAPPTCNCRTISQHHSPENHHVKFLSQPCSFFRKFMSCTHTKFLGYPGAYEMHDAISTQFIQHMLIYKTCIYINIIKAHKTCYAHSPSITPKISSYRLINKHEQFNLNYSTKYIILQKYLVNTIHVNSEPSGYCSRPLSQHWFHFVNPKSMAISGLMHITTQFNA